MSTAYKTGLVLLGVLSLGDLAAPLYTDGQHPPMSIALIESAIGLLSLILLVLASRGRTAAAIGLAVLRLLSALTAVPAFFVPGVPAVPMALAGIAITATLVGVGCVFAGIWRPALAGAR
jgi:hypothetical protein